MLGAAVWGAGWVSGEHLKAYKANPNVQVVAVGSSSKQRARAKADEVGLKCDVYDDLDELLQRDDLHVVSITTPRPAMTFDTVPARYAINSSGRLTTLINTRPVDLSMRYTKPLAGDLTRPAEVRPLAAMTVFIVTSAPSLTLIYLYARAGGTRNKWATFTTLTSPLTSACATG